MAKRIKCYTDEQLSIILGEHDAGHLERGGCPCWNMPWQTKGAVPGPGCCINQAAYNEPWPFLALRLNPVFGARFDAYYSKSFTPEQMLEFITQKSPPIWKELQTIMRPEVKAAHDQVLADHDKTFRKLAEHEAERKE